jgi:hypothetical protein
MFIAAWLPKLGVQAYNTEWARRFVVALSWYMVLLRIHLGRSFEEIVGPFIAESPGHQC